MRKLGGVQREEKVKEGMEENPKHAGHEKSVKLVRRHLPASSRREDDGVERRRKVSDTLSRNHRLEEAARADCGTRQDAGSVRRTDWNSGCRKRRRHDAGGRLKGLFVTVAYWTWHGATGGERTHSRPSTRQGGTPRSRPVAALKRTSRRRSAAVIASDEAGYIGQPWGCYRPSACAARRMRCVLPWVLSTTLRAKYAMRAHESVRGAHRATTTILRQLVLVHACNALRLLRSRLRSSSNWMRLTRLGEAGSSTRTLPWAQYND